MSMIYLALFDRAVCSNHVSIIGLTDDPKNPTKTAHIINTTNDKAVTTLQNQFRTINDLSKKIHAVTQYYSKNRQEISIEDKTLLDEYKIKLEQILNDINKTNPHLLNLVEQEMITSSTLSRESESKNNIKSTTSNTRLPKTYDFSNLRKEQTKTNMEEIEEKSKKPEDTSIANVSLESKTKRKRSKNSKKTTATTKRPVKGRKTLETHINTTISQIPGQSVVIEIPKPTALEPQIPSFADTFAPTGYLASNSMSSRAQQQAQLTSENFYPRYNPAQHLTVPSSQLQTPSTMFTLAQPNQYKPQYYVVQPAMPYQKSNNYFVPINYVQEQPIQPIYFNKLN